MTSAQTDRSQRWRTLWRVHFYAGIFAFPFILLMATTGLVILYTQPIQDLAERDLRTVTATSATVSYNAQAREVEKVFPQAPIVSLTIPKDGTHSAIFHLDDRSAAGRDVFVNTHTGVVLGSTKTGGGFVGFANRVHGFLNQKTLTVSLPTVSALWDHGKILRPYIVGDLVLELLAVWTLVLVMSGVVLWWPRRGPRRGPRQGSRQGSRRGSRRFGIRRGATGRARWRDLHATGGVVLFSFMVLTIVSGLGWSTYWGPNFTSLANEVSPNAWTDTPTSPLGTRADLDRFGNQLPWNTADLALPASYAPPDPTRAAPLSLDAVVRIAAAENLRPGYQISFPKNVVDSTAATTTYGSFALTNSWPRKTTEARTLYLDQFTGRTTGDMRANGYGAVSKSMDTLVSIHMGTQLGLVSRVAMTMVCVLAMWSVSSAAAMYFRRRRPGAAGLPRRPVDVHFAKRINAIVAVMAIVFPIWGMSAVAILAIDRFLIRRVPRLRHTFGQR